MVILVGWLIVGSYQSCKDKESRNSNKIWNNTKNKSKISNIIVNNLLILIFRSIVNKKKVILNMMVLSIIM
jgi:hypothetical protein